MEIAQNNITAKHRAMRALAAAALLVAFLLAALPLAARADVLDTDRVGSIELATNEAVRAAAPDVNCGFGALMAADGTILWQRAADVPVPMASTTKIMTALVVLGLGQPDDKVVVSEAAAATDGSTAYLTAGDELTTEQMLYAMMLPSGNDAAVALAERYAGGDVNGFVALMNAKASEIGMTSTHFSSPSGLEDQDNYTTATDYLKLVSCAMSNELFRRIVATPEFSYTSTVTGYTVTLQSTDVLLSQYEGMLGVKTGHTDAAGYCFVGAASRDGVELYSVVLNNPTEWGRFTDTVALMDWGFAHYRRALLLGGNAVVGNAVATAWLDRTVPVVAREDAFGLVFDYEPDLVQEVDIHDRGGVIDRGSNMGTVRWLRDGELVTQIDLVAANEVPAPSIIESIQIGWYRFAGFFTGHAPTAEQSVVLGDTFPLGGPAGNLAVPPSITVQSAAEEPLDEAA